MPLELLDLLALPLRMEGGKKLLAFKFAIQISLKCLFQEGHVLNIFRASTVGLAQPPETLSKACCPE